VNLKVYSNALEVYNHLTANPKIKPSLNIYNSMLRMHADRCQSEIVLSLTREMKERNIQPDKDSYVSMLRCYGKSRQQELIKVTTKEIIASSVEKEEKLFSALIEANLCLTVQDILMIYNYWKENVLNFNKLSILSIISELERRRMVKEANLLATAEKLII